MLLFEDKIPNNRIAFSAKEIDISKRLSIDPNWLMGIMYHESGLNPAAYNPNGGATGLIQFMPSTATSLRTTTSALRLMSNVQQLDYVYAYFKPYTGRIKNIYDLFMITFFPIAIGKSDDWVFETKKISRSKIAQANPAFDLNKDGQITVGEWKQYLKSWFEKRKIDPSLFVSAGISIGGILFGTGLFF